MEEIKKTQHEHILNFIKDFGSITPFEAFSELGITKLATRVSELRRSGCPIGGFMETRKNRYGKNIRYKRYFLEVSKENR